jgi:hypothetical protein
MSTKYTVWIKCRYDDSGYVIAKEERVWEVSEGGCTSKQADRISREIRADFDCSTRILPDGAEAPI